MARLNQLALYRARAEALELAIELALEDAEPVQNT
jgi:hypothetical protein